MKVKVAPFGNPPHRSLEENLWRMESEFFDLEFNVGPGVFENAYFLKCLKPYFVDGDLIYV